MCKAPLWHVVCLSHICRSNEVLRRTYGKDDRVLHTAKLSRGFKVVPGAGISTGGTKIGVTGSETRTAKLRLSNVGNNQEQAEELRSCGGVLPASGFRSSKGAKKVSQRKPQQTRGQ
jgi:hypothetical protein